ncbi:MAG TPA: alkaline shock response membrane anchor protein AmaP [Bacillota bacterium]|nr:alkaline shock response membrane anchor protein AmaP [Bacillota bacterium]HOH10748.1 alkaline shock response membrane anchor protein AmaP [Bacillota bacterium]HOS50583.1 alkaline shock response membrane anchor protein AmaP [Bacillota bacterium]HOY89926.1 alkaline shock response membrane anchor protein AmaP [Bacillota bacterium]HPI01523.1 alkaline shock response membrane anchor protein AmaP [Bacillota bacterium]
MKLLDRIVTLIAAILIGTLSLMALSQYVGGYIGAAGDWLYDRLMYSWVTTFLVQIAVIIVMAYLFEMTIRTGKSEGKMLKRTTETGDIFVSVGTIESFARNLAKEVEGVQEVDMRTKSGPEGLDMVLKVAAAKDAVIPELVSKLESRIKEALPAQSGFPVRSVKIHIRSAV